MAIVEIYGGPLTEQKLMRKTKSELAHELLNALRELDALKAKLREGR